MYGICIVRACQLTNAPNCMHRLLHVAYSLEIAYSAEWHTAILQNGTVLHFGTSILQNGIFRKLVLTKAYAILQNGTSILQNGLFRTLVLT